MTGNKYVHQALMNLFSAKLRSFLAVLGILVGTASVVALIGCGQLATEKALAQFKALGTELLSLSVYQKNTGPDKTDLMSLSQWRAIPERVPAVAKIAPYVTTYQPMSYEGSPLNGAIIGADDSLKDILHIDMAQGNFVSFVDTFEHFCVLGAAVAEALRAIRVDDPLGKQLRIGNALYTIIGIAKPWQENAFFNEDVNHAVIIPIKGMPLIYKTSKISNAVLRLKPNQSIEPVIADLKQTILNHAQEANVFVRSAQQIIASMENQGKIFTMLLAVIGGISLLVGGIGVMNVMLVSVSERKKEIGIRKAVGAKNKEIQALFLMESVILSLIGGLMGVVLGVLCTWVIAWFNQWAFSFHALPACAGFVVSVATGVFFGFYPAKRASLLEPIASLRAE